MKRWQKILIGVGGVLLVLLLIGFIFIKSLGKVNVPKFEKISENTYAYSEGLNQSNIYLVIGEEKAALIDTGNGLSDLPKGIEEITDLPVIVINTHGHYDHIRGNHYFKEIYMSEKDDEVFSRHRTAEEVEKQISGISGFIKLIMKYQNKTIMETPVNEEYLPLPEEGYFDLGNRRLEFVELAGHTPGSTGFLDTKTGELFCGDAITTSGVLLHLPESLSVSTQLETLDTVQKLIDEGKVKTLYGGHATFKMDNSIITTFKEGLNKIKNNELTDEEKKDGRIVYEGLEIKFDLEKIK